MPAIRIGSNIDSLVVQRNLSQATDSYSQSAQRLSSGLRINKTADDPAGLALASQTKLNSRVAGQSAKNINDGISLYNVADSALSSLLDITNKQLELASQAASEGYTLTQRRALDTEAEALRQEYNRIVTSTSYNQKSLLDRSLVTGLTIQAGMGSAASITGNLAQELSRTTGTGTFGGASGVTIGTGLSGPRIVQTADFNNDSKPDFITSASGSGQFSYALGTGSGTFGTVTNVNLAGISDIAVADFDGDGNQDMAATIYNGGIGNTVSVRRGNGDGTFAAPTSYTVGSGPIPVIFADFNGDSLLDIAAGNYGSGTTSILINNGSGGFNAAINSTTGTSIQLAAADFNGDGNTDLASVEGNNTVSILLGNGNGTFDARTTYATGNTSVSIAARDINYDGVPDVVTGNYAAGTSSVLLGNTDGTLQTATTVNTGAGTRNVYLEDLDGDGLADLINSNESTNSIDIRLGQGDGTFGSATVRSTGIGPFSVAFADFNRDGATDMINSNFNFSNGSNVAILIANSRSLTTVGRLNLLTVEDATKSISTITGTMNRVNLELGVVGASGRRFEHALRVAEVARENYAAAGSRITDADIAEETANLLRSQIVQDSATALLAQANQTPELALSLLTRNSEDED